jgi:hypothetical protein
MSDAQQPASSSSGSAWPWLLVLAVLVFVIWFRAQAAAVAAAQAANAQAAQSTALSPMIGAATINTSVTGNLVTGIGAQASPVLGQVVPTNTATVAEQA